MAQFKCDHMPRRFKNLTLSNGSLLALFWNKSNGLCVTFHLAWQGKGDVTFRGIQKEPHSDVLCAQLVFCLEWAGGVHSEKTEWDRCSQSVHPHDSCKSESVPRHLARCNVFHAKSAIHLFCRGADSSWSHSVFGAVAFNLISRL